MTIDEYCQEISIICDRAATLPHVLTCEYTLEKRPPDQAYLHGHIVWINGSELHWMEYCDAELDAVKKLRFSYHLQDKNHALVFRYDNAAHKPQLPYKEHKHFLDGDNKQLIIQANAPTLHHVVEESALFYGWL